MVKKRHWLAASLWGLGWLTIAPIARSQPNAASSTPPAIQRQIDPSRPHPETLTENSDSDPMAQVTSVDQLSDLKPSDWAYQAVKALVERYGILDGYPDGTFRGNQPLTRFEFVATLSNLISRIEEQLLAGNIGGTAQQDVLTIRRLLNAYGIALDDLRVRIDRISNRTTALERQVFSPTAKLYGRSDLALTNGTRHTFSLVNRNRIGITASLQGSDRLVAEMEAGNNERDAVAKAHQTPSNALGTLGVLADGGGLDAIGSTQDVKLRKLYYAFRPSNQFEVAIGTQIPPSDFIDRNTFANQSGQNFGSSFFANNPLIVQNELDRFGGAGAVVSWRAQNNFTVRGLVVSAAAANPTRGLLTDRDQASVEAEYSLPKHPLILRLQYTHGEINGTRINAGGINAEWTTQRRYGVFGLFGRFGFGSYRGFNSVLNEDLDLNPKTWTVGTSIQNFLIPGSKAGLAIGQPFVTRKLGNATQTNVEAFFGLALNDSITVNPTLLVVSNPNNRRGPTIWEWAVRVLYTF